MQSLTSKGYVKTQFSWQWYYYTLTPEGLDYLREVSRTPRNARPLGEDQMRWMAFFFSSVLDFGGRTAIGTV